MSKLYTISELSFLLSQRHDCKVPEWKLRNTIDKVFPNLPRVGQARAVPEDSIGELENELQKQGWITATETAEVEA